VLVKKPKPKQAKTESKQTYLSQCETVTTLHKRVDKMFFQGRSFVYSDILY